MRSIAPQGVHITRLRALAGMTQQELARKAGYSVKVIWKAEQGKNLRIQTLHDIAGTLDVDVSQLMADPTEAAPVDARPSSRIVVEDALAAYLAEDARGVLQTLHPDIRFVVPGPPDYPIAGIHEGKQAVEQFLKTSFATFERSHEPTFDRWVVDGDCIDVHLTDRLSFKRNQASLEIAICYSFELQGDKIISAHQYCDLSTALTALRQQAPPRKQLQPLMDE